MDTRANVQAIKPEHVVRVYSGRVGCMCGCNGTYKLNPMRVEESEIDRYEIEPEELSLRSVNIVLNKIKRMVASGQYEKLDVNEERIYVENKARTRCLAAFLQWPS